MESALAIDVRGMTKCFNGKTVVNQIELEVKKGEIFGFLGPNGSGKTTFIRMLCGLLRADGGSGRVLEFDVLRESDRIKREVGYMTQRFSFYEDLSIEENLDFVARMYEMKNAGEAVETALQSLGLFDRRRQLAGQLSGGWKQRLALAACLIHRPRLLLLDEPTAGVDPKARRDFWDQVHLLAMNGLTVLITTHYMDEAERCHRLAYISKGRLLTKGTVAEVIESASLSTYLVFGENLPAVAEEIRHAPESMHAVAFGASLHVSGADYQAIERQLRSLSRFNLEWQKIDTSLEDVFIHLMDTSDGGAGR